FRRLLPLARGASMGDDEDARMVVTCRYSSREPTFSRARQQIDRRAHRVLARCTDFVSVLNTHRFRRINSSAFLHSPHALSSSRGGKSKSQNAPGETRLRSAVQ